MTRPIAGISIALFVYALLAALLPLLVQLLILPVEAEANAIAMIFWIGVLLLGAHYASPRDPEKTAELENPLAGFRTALAFTAVALAVGFILYADALRGPFLGGDWSMIARAEALDNAHGLGEALRLLFMPARGVDYHGPLDQLTWWVQYRVWGTNPAPYRVFNLLLHVFNSVLLLRLAARVLRGRTSALIAAGLFVLSPLAIECVVWVSARKDLLGVFFLVATLNTYLRHREKHSRLLGWASLGLFVLGLLSGTLVTLTPIVLFVGEGAGFFPIDETAEARRRSRRELMTFATLALVFFAIWIAARGPSPIPPFADAIDFIGVRVPNQLFVPLYANVGPFDPIDKLSVAGLVLMVVLLSGVTSRGESRSPLLALLMIVIGAAAPFLFGDEPSASAGWRPLYLPALGFALLFGQALTSPPESPRRRRVAKGAWVALLIAASVWGIRLNEGPWRGLLGEVGDFHKQAIAEARAARPGDRFHFIGFPIASAIQIPGYLDGYPPPLVIARQLRAQGGPAAPRIDILTEKGLVAGDKARSARYDWREMDWGGRDHLFTWQSAGHRLLRLDPLLVARRGAATRAAAAALDDSVTSPSRPLQVWRRHVDSARPGAVRWRLRSTDPRGWDPSVYGTLIVHGRQDGHGPKTRLKLSVEWRSPNLAGTTLAAPKMLVELPVDPASTRNSWRVDLLRSIAWALSDTITDLVVEVEGGVRVTQIRLAATGG